MANKDAVFGITILEWHATEHIPAMHTEEYAGETWLQSELLLLADNNGMITVGYCQQSPGGTAEFDAAFNHEIGKILMWALLGKAPVK